MAQPIPESHRDILEKKSLAHLATLMPDGSPQVTPVWCDFDGVHVRVNSARGRRKDRNMRRDPRVSLSLCDPDNPYRYLEIRGQVVEIDPIGADLRQHHGLLSQQVGAGRVLGQLGVEGEFLSRWPMAAA